MYLEKKKESLTQILPLGQFKAYVCSVTSNSRIALHIEVLPFLK